MNQKALPIFDPLITGGSLCRHRYSEDFENLWADIPKRHGNNNKVRAWKAYQRRLKEGYTHKQMAAGMKRWRKWCEAEGIIGNREVMMVSTFLGPDENFLEPWEVSEDPPRENDKLVEWGTAKGNPPRPGESFAQYRRRLSKQ